MKNNVEKKFFKFLVESRFVILRNCSLDQDPNLFQMERIHSKTKGLGFQRKPVNLLQLKISKYSIKERMAPMQPLLKLNICIGD